MRDEIINRLYDRIEELEKQVSYYEALLYAKERRVKDKDEDI